VLAGTTETKLYTINVGERIVTTDMASVVEHESFDFADEGKPEAADVMKHVSKIRPRVLAQAGSQMRFQVGTQMHINDPIEWGAEQIFTVGTDDELCLGVNGRYISWRIRGCCENTWRLEAIDFLIQTGGRF